MRDDLVAVEVEHARLGFAAPHVAAEDAGVEGPSGLEVVHREGEMEGPKRQRPPQSIGWSRSHARSEMYS